MIVAAMALVQFAAIKPAPLSQAAVYALGYLAFVLNLKLISGAVFGLFIGQADGATPRGAMLLLALILMVGGMFLLTPLLSGYAV